MKKIFVLGGTITNVESSGFADYIGIKSLKPYIDKDSFIAELIEFLILALNRVKKGEDKF